MNCIRYERLSPICCLDCQMGIIAYWVGLYWLHLSNPAHSCTKFLIIFVHGFYVVALSMITGPWRALPSSVWFVFLWTHLLSITYNFFHNVFTYTMCPLTDTSCWRSTTGRMFSQKTFDQQYFLQMSLLYLFSNTCIVWHCTC